ncbi:MAG TPA: hypothetical protein VK158_06390 [Acidobacteriota bacterium]|nr:hypothetical protein [Acidobacteriota bacterium]
MVSYNYPKNIEKVLLDGSDIVVALHKPTSLPDFALEVARMYCELSGNQDIVAGDISLLMIPELMNQGKRVWSIQKNNQTNPQFQIWGNLAEKKAYRIMPYTANSQQRQDLYSRLEREVCK